VFLATALPLLTVPATTGHAAGSTKKVKIDLVIPARYPEVARRPSVIVFDLAALEETDTSVGAAFADTLRERLQDARVNDEPVFFLQATSGGAVFDAQSAVSIGISQGAGAVYYGTIKGGALDIEDYTERRKKCLDEDPFGLKLAIGKCKNSTEEIVDCKRQTASFDVTLRVADVNTREMIYEKLVTRTKTESYCADDDTADLVDLIRAAENGSADDASTVSGMSVVLINQIREEIADEVRDDVVPRTEEGTVLLKRYARNQGEPAPSTREGKKVEKQRQKRFDASIKWAQRGRWDRACGDWSAMLDEKPENVALLYNLGICAEARGDVERAVVLYMQASDMLFEPDDIVLDALDRAELALDTTM
jgi:hypothetical protein